MATTIRFFDGDKKTVYNRLKIPRVKNRVQLTTDGHKPYLEAVEEAFGYFNIDYAMLIKMYGAEPGKSAAARYSPPKVTAAHKEPIFGNPDLT